MISREEVAYVVRLARLHFNEEETGQLQGELSTIIDYIQRLNEFDLSGVAPTAHAVNVTNVFRPDEPRACLTQEEALANAPKAERGHFSVPRIG